MINQYVGDPCLLNSLSMMMQEMLCQALWTEAPRDVHRCQPELHRTSYRAPELPRESWDPDSKNAKGIQGRRGQKTGNRWEQCLYQATLRVL
jgi:hypothetical protein